MTDIVATANLLGAIETVDQLIAQLREIQAAGIEVSVEQMALASASDCAHEDPLLVVARLSLLLAVALTRAAQ